MAEKPVKLLEMLQLGSDRRCRHPGTSLAPLSYYNPVTARERWTLNHDMPTAVLMAGDRGQRPFLASRVVKMAKRLFVHPIPTNLESELPLCFQPWAMHEMTSTTRLCSSSRS